MNSTQATVDEFAGDEYGPAVTSLPYLQVLNNQNPEQSGFFISTANAEAVNFTPSQEWEPFEAQFQSGAEVGFRSLVARLAIVRRSPLLMFSRETKEFLGPFDRSRYDAATVLLKTRYLGYLYHFYLILHYCKNHQCYEWIPLIATI